MIARLWRGLAGSAAAADAYQRHVTGSVFPELKKIAGADPERAVVEPEARAVLVEYDERVRHYEVVQ